MLELERMSFVMGTKTQNISIIKHLNASNVMKSRVTLMTTESGKKRKRSWKTLFNNSTIIFSLSGGHPMKHATQNLMRFLTKSFGD